MQKNNRKENRIEFENFQVFLKRYEKILDLIPFSNFNLEDIEKLFTKLDKFAYYFKDFLKNLDWEKNLNYVIYNLIKKYIGLLYETKTESKNKIFMKQNKESYFRFFFKILISFSNDDISEISLNYKIILLEEFFNYFTCNSRVEDIINETISYIFFISSFLQEFFGLIIHFYLNLENLNSIGTLSELLSISKIKGEFDLYYCNKDYLALLDGNLRKSFGFSEKTIILNNREAYFNKILFILTGFQSIKDWQILSKKNIAFAQIFDVNNLNTNNLSVKLNKMSFKEFNQGFLLSNLKEIKELFSPFLITYFLIYGKSYLKRSKCL